MHLVDYEKFVNERLRFGEALARIDPEAGETAVGRVGDGGLFTSIQDRNHVLQAIRMELPVLDRASVEFYKVIAGDPERTREEVELLATGFDMANLVLYELVREGRRIG